MFNDPWKIANCPKDSKADNCDKVSSTDLTCRSYSSNLADYYTGCPKMTKENCGLTRNFKDLDIYAGNDKKSFSFNGTRYKTEEYKLATVQACSYKIMTPPGGFFGGKVYLTVKEPEAGVNLYLNYDGTNIVPTYGTKMSVKTGEEFILTVVP